MPLHHEEAQYPTERGLRPYSEALDKVQERLLLDRAKPLVKLQERLPDGRIAVEIFDRDRGGDEPAYDFYCRDLRQALEWIQQMAPKQWVTKRHLELFASAMLAAFPESNGSAA